MRILRLLTERMQLEQTPKQLEASEENSKPAETEGDRGGLEIAALKATA